MTRPGPTRPNSRPNLWFSLLKLTGVIIVAAILTAGVLLPYVGGLGLVARTEASRFLDTTCDLQETAPPQGTTFYANDGTTVLATIFEQNRKPVDLTEIPVYLQKALVDTEDRRFYSHHGVDVRGLMRSAFSTSGGDTQGGSTLTMQYVKQSRYYRDIGDIAKQTADIDQNIDRKLQDAKCALELEKRESKNEILANYLNIAFFGQNSYSVESAAETYFNKRVSQLDVPESAMLVGILRAPTQYDPFQHPAAARDRRNQVLQNMVTEGDLTPAQGKAYQASPVHLATLSPPSVEQGCYNAPNTIANVGFFCSYVETWLANVEGIKEQDIKTGGFKIITTLDPKIQNSAQKALLFSAASPTTALMPVVDPHNGNVLAMVSSKAYGLTDDGKHRADAIFTDSNARSASTYKYFTMVAALEAGAPSTMPISNNSGNGTTYQTQHCGPSPFIAKNGDQAINYKTTETMSSAIAKSSNTYFVGIEDGLFGCDLTPILDTMKTLGMTYLEQKDPSSTNGKDTYRDEIIRQSQPILTLGEYPTSPLELTAAYAAAANDGVYCTPAPVTAIKDKNGKPLAVKRTPCTQAMTPQVAREAAHLLLGDTGPGGTSANVFSAWNAAHPGAPIGGKTGTDIVSLTKNSPELNTSFWFVGMTKSMVATMALINVTNPLKPLSGIPGIADAAAQTTADGSVAARFWLATLSSTLTTRPAGTFSWPSPATVAGSVPVPNVVGMAPSQASQTLKLSGFMVAQFPVFCGSTVQYGLVGFQSPQYAVKGTTVTICLSNLQPAYTTPPFTVTPKPPSNTATKPPTSTKTSTPSRGHSTPPPHSPTVTPPAGGH